MSLTLPTTRLSPAQMAALHAGEAEGHHWYHQLTWLVDGRIATRTVKWLVGRGYMEIVYEGETRARARITPEGRKALHEYRRL